jgi:hypothetical protein
VVSPAGGPGWRDVRICSAEWLPPEGEAAVIEGIFGLPGQGKTYEAVRRLLLAADAGRQCFSVTPVNHPNVERITYDDLVDPYLPPGLILLDEVHIKLPAGSHQRLDEDWYAKLSQTRKDGHDLLYTSQHESKVLKQLRDNTNYGWVTQAWGLGGGHPWVFSAKSWEMHKLRRGKPSDRYIHRFSQRVADAYSTTFSIREGAATQRRSAGSYATTGSGNSLNRQGA